MNDEQIASVIEGLTQHLEKDKPWIRSDLTIDDLSDNINIPKHHLSHAISAGLNTSFYDLLNNYRVEEVKRRLKAGATNNYSLMGIATESGFGSKSSFYRIFKKKTGSTPSDYLKQNNIKNAN